MPEASERAHWPGSSAVVVPVPALEEWVQARSAHYDPAYVSPDPRFAHAHITLLGPFLEPATLTPAMVRRVGEVLAQHQPFVTRLDTIDAFPDGMIHLLPSPSEPFRRLTAALVDAFPQFPPYAGRSPDVRPHLTLDRVGPGVDTHVVRRWVADLLPVVLHVSEARLSWYEQDACRTVATWRIGG